MDLFYGKNRVRGIGKKEDREYFHHKRWQLLTIMEQISGFWPLQSKLNGYFLKTFHFVVLLSIISAVVNKLREFVEDGDVDMITECSLTLMFLFSIMVKLLFASAMQNKRLDIYKKISANFKLVIDEDEKKILEDYTDRGFIYTATYIGMACIAVVIFDSVPILRSFYNYYYGNGKLDMQFPIQLNYGFNHSKYWYLVTLNFLMFVGTGCIVDFTFDLSFILQVHHVLALFEIVENRLKKVSEFMDEIEVEPFSKDATDTIYSLISSVVQLHSDCLDLIKIIEKTYSTNWFVILLINTSFFGAGVHLISMRFHDKVETFRNFFAFTLILMHFFVIFSQGQKVSNSCSSMAFACYDCKWYSLPKKSSKLLVIMMMRTLIPCELTGTKLFPLSLETFGKMLKAGLSYYTVFQT